MPTLNWLRESDEEPLNNGQILRREKKLILEGDHYKAPPDRFYVIRRPCPAIEAMLSWMRRDRWKEYAQREVEVVEDEPWISVRSVRTVEIGNVGFAHTHRWNFTDLEDNWSYTIRLARMASVRTRAKGGAGVGTGRAKADGSITIEGKVNVGVDPELLIDLVTPWSDSQQHGTTIEGIIESEVAALVDENGKGEEAPQFMKALLDAQPGFVVRGYVGGAFVKWDSVRTAVAPGDGFEVEATIGLDGPTSGFVFPFCLTVHEPSGELLDTSDVMFASSTGRGDIRIDFMEGYGVR